MQCLLFILSGGAVFPEQEPADQEYFSKFVTLSTVRRSIHVGNLTFHSGLEVEKYLLQDVMKSIKPWLGVLMDNYRVRSWRTIVFLIPSEPPSGAPCFCTLIVPVIVIILTSF